MFWPLLSRQGNLACFRKSDQHEFSPNNKDTINIKVIRSNELITIGKKGLTLTQFFVLFTDSKCMNLNVDTRA